MSMADTYSNDLPPMKKGAHQPAHGLLKALIGGLWLLSPAGLFIIAWIEAGQGGTNLLSMAEGGFFIGLAFVLIALVGALAAMGQPRNATGWVLLFSGLTITLAGVAGAWGDYLLDSFGRMTRVEVAGWIGGLGWYTGLGLLFVIFPFLYPDGRMAGRLWRVVFAAAATVFAGIISLMIVAPLFLPTRFELEPIEALIDRLFLVIPLFGLLGVASLAVRYRHSSGDVRLQMKWLLVAIGAPLIAFLLFISLEEFIGASFSNLLWGVLYLLIPLGLGIALLRYRMFDIDTIIRKTAVYGALTALLALFYFGVIVILQGMLSPLTGDSEAVVVLSTLLIAALFLPLRRRIQVFIDRRFYRRKYDAEKVLARFAATVRDETDLDELTAELLRVIQETMEPEHVSVWLKPSTDKATFVAPGQMSDHSKQL